jgi:hypothetical protein
MRFSGYEVEKKRLSHTAAMQKSNEIVDPKEIGTPKGLRAGPAGYENGAQKVALLSRRA